MSETVAKADSLGAKLWDRAAGFPVEFTSRPKIGGVASLWDLESQLGRRLPLYNNETGKPSEAILSFEKEQLAR